MCTEEQVKDECKDISYACKSVSVKSGESEFLIVLVGISIYILAVDTMIDNAAFILEHIIHWNEEIAYSMWANLVERYSIGSIPDYMYQRNKVAAKRMREKLLNSEFAKDLNTLDALVYLM